MVRHTLENLTMITMIDFKSMFRHISTTHERESDVTLDQICGSIDLPKNISIKLF